jgi:hypothetical protein
MKMSDISKLPDQWRRKSTPVKLQGYMTASCCADELEAALADQWQPIETAPKDGEIIILFADVPWRIRIGYCDSGSGKAHSIPQGSTLHDQPTHWMPLPTPPQKDQNDAD